MVFFHCCTCMRRHLPHYAEAARLSQGACCLADLDACSSVYLIFFWTSITLPRPAAFSMKLQYSIWEQMCPCCVSCRHAEYVLQRTHRQFSVLLTDFHSSSKEFSIDHSRSFRLKLSLSLFPLLFSSCLLSAPSSPLLSRLRLIEPGFTFLQVA